MSESKDTCLQCGRTREEVRWESTSCGVTSDYDVFDLLDEWDRHHWRDWSDAELAAQGIHPSLWDANRRTGIYDLEWPALASMCIENGHRYPNPWHPPMHLDALKMFPPDDCLVCYETRTEAVRGE